MQSKSVIFILSIILPTVFVGCSKNDVLSEQKMVEVITDIQLAQSIYQIKGVDYMPLEAKDALFAGVLEKHNITEARFDSSLVWYSDRTDRLMRIEDSVRVKLQEQLTVLESNSTKNNRLIPETFVLDAETPIYSFSLQGNELVGLDKDNIDWSFDVFGLSDQLVVASISYTYADTLIVRQDTLKQNMSYSLSNNEKIANLQNVSAFIRLKTHENTDPVYLYRVKINSLGLPKLTEKIR